MPERPSYSGSEEKVEYPTGRPETQSSSDSSIQDQLDDLKAEVESQQTNKKK